MFPVPLLLIEASSLSSDSISLNFSPTFSVLLIVDDLDDSVVVDVVGGDVVDVDVASVDLIVVVVVVVEVEVEVEVVGETVDDVEFVDFLKRSDLRD